jgi:hypothetical protein
MRCWMHLSCFWTIVHSSQAWIWLKFGSLKIKLYIYSIGYTVERDTPTFPI